MRILWQMIGVIIMVTTFFATYGILIADALEVNLWGLKWQYWAMIVFTILWVSAAIYYYKLHLVVKGLQSKLQELTGEEAELDRQIKRQQLTGPITPIYAGDKQVEKKDDKLESE